MGAFWRDLNWLLMNTPGERVQVNITVSCTVDGDREIAPARGGLADAPAFLSGFSVSPAKQNVGSVAVKEPREWFDAAYGPRGMGVEEGVAHGDNAVTQ